MAVFTPTIEQTNIGEESLTGKTFKVKARAGTGKTATAKLVADANDLKRIIYMVFNRKASEEAKAKMPTWVDARTAHSLAWAPTYRGTAPHQVPT